MNKNTTDITLSAYFNDIVIGYYEDEDLVKQFGRQLGFDVDMDTFMAVSFQYPSDMNVKPEAHRRGKRDHRSLRYQQEDRWKADYHLRQRRMRDPDHERQIRNA